MKKTTSALALLIAVALSGCAATSGSSTPVAPQATPTAPAVATDVQKRDLADRKSVV